MATRRPNLTNALIEIGFVLIAGAAGFAGGPAWSVAALTLAMVLYWLWSRRRTLREMAALKRSALIGSALVTLVLLAAVLGGAFWLGRWAGGHA